MPRRANPDADSNAVGGLTGSGLYLHVPFCSSICPYCDFAVMKGDRERRQRFVETLVAELALVADFDQPIDTVYFGGGTPSILLPGELAAILGTARERLAIDSKAWTSLEANPEDVTPENLEAWRNLGVGMLSLGVQSFDDESLGFLGRVHDGDRARRAVCDALVAGFQTVSIDLIYGLPGQTIESWRRDLVAAIELGPQHISCYQLTVHEKTVFGVLQKRGRFTQLGPERQADLFFETHERLGRAGFEGYEVSNFSSAPGHRSRHNQKYWNHTPYLGVGPSAHSFDGRSRWWNEWKEGPWSRRVESGKRPVAGSEVLSTRDLAFERLMLALRTSAGLDLEALRRDLGVDLLETNHDLVDDLIDEDLIERRGARLVPTLAGMAIADMLAQRFEIFAAD